MGWVFDSDEDTKSISIFVSDGYARVTQSHDYIMSKKPEYGYARDIFGRVQERDRYKEETHEKPKYDYSSYDREDDHDNYYYNDLND